VGALIGLRCYCPAIVSPELYNLVKPGTCASYLRYRHGVVLICLSIVLVSRQLSRSSGSGSEANGHFRSPVLIDSDPPTRVRSSGSLHLSAVGAKGTPHLSLSLSPPSVLFSPMLG
jgi:hypothetical protein